MGCTNPNFVVKTNEIVVMKNGKETNKYLFGRNYLKNISNDTSYIDKETGELMFEKIPVRCGECLSCRLSYSKEWANRIILESTLYDPGLCWFVTLTYRDDELSEENGTRNIWDVPILNKEHIKTFMKDLRNYYFYRGHKGIREFTCGEYGEKSERPHYHQIIFNLPLSDLQFFSTNFRGDIFYTSDTLTEIWGRGHVLVSELTWQNAAYTARYVLKKAKDQFEKEFYKQMDITMPFTTKSNRPGLAVNYFKEHFDEIYQSDNIVLPSVGKLQNVVKPPRYCDILYKEVNPDHLEKVKLHRQFIAQVEQDRLRKTHNYSEEDYFRMKDEELHNKIKKLHREL